MLYLVILMMVSQIVYTHISIKNISCDNNPASTQVWRLLPEFVTSDATLRMVFTRSFQSFLLPAFYMYSLYDTEDCDEEE